MGRFKSDILTRSLVLAVLAGLCACDSDNIVTDDGEVQPSEVQPSTRPIDQGMEPLYVMADTFLNIVHPASRGFFTNALGISASDLIEQPVTVFENIGDDWQPWAKHYVGFAACIAVGILYIIIMPIVGCCFCICRCAGRCGARSHKNPEKGSQKYKRICCGLFLLLFNTLMLAGMVCAFVTNELLRERTSMTDEGVLSKTVRNIKSLEDYKDSTFNEFRTGTIASLRTRVDEIIDQLEDVPIKARQNISDITQAGEVIEKAEALVKSVEAINESLAGVNQNTKALITDTTSLNTQLAGVKSDASATLASAACTMSKCSEIKTQIDKITINTDYSSVDDVEAELNKIRDILEENLSGLVKGGKLEFEKIADMILNDTQAKIDDIKNEKERVMAELENEIDNVIKSIDESIPLNGTYSAIEDIKGDTEEYGNYRYYGGIGIASILLLIVLLYYLGLCFGACGETSGEDASCCNKGIGATVLMVGVAFTFLFCWLMMLVVLILFLAGGTIYTEACRPIGDLNNSSLTLLQSTLENFGVVKFDLHKAVHDCRQGEGIFTAFELEKNFDLNLRDILNINNSDYKIQEKMDDLINSVDLSDLSSIEIVSADTLAQLDELRQSGLDNIDFQTYRDQLKVTIVSPDLGGIVNDLRDVAGLVNDPLKSDINRHADDLDDIDKGLLARMRDSVKKLQAALNTLDTEFKKAKDGSSAFTVKVDELKKSLLDAQARIRNEGERLIKDFIEHYGQHVLQNIQEYLTERRIYIETEIGQCRPVYDVLISSIDVVCDDLLDPFNGFWFSIGWCVFFFIPCIIVAVCLISLYRRTDDYDDYNRSFDEANYDAYTGVYPGDNIPLEDYEEERKYHLLNTGLNGRQKSQPNGSGTQNQGYARDDMTSRSGGYRDNRNQGYRQEQQRNGYPGDYSRGGYGGTNPPGYSSAGPHYDQHNSRNPPHYHNNRARAY